MPCICLPCRGLRQAPVESYFKLLMGILGILGEFVTGIKISYQVPSSLNTTQMSDEHHEHNHEHVHKRDITDERVKVFHFEDGNIQHITMYSAFVIGALVEILMYKKYEIPKKLDFVCGILGFSVEAFLFYFHLHAREPIDVHVHVLLFYTVVGCIFFVALEMSHPHQVLFTYGRILFTMLQGTWFYQIGFVLYPPFDSPRFKWNLSDHNQMMVITASYCWHVFAILFFLIIQLWAIKKCYHSSKTLASEMDELIDIELQDDNVSIDYRRLRLFDSKLKHLNSQDEDSNDETVTFQQRTNIS